MIKKIASKFFGKHQTQLPLENKVAEVFDEDALEEYFHRLPGFPQGIPVIPVEILIRKNEEMIKQIILARGMAGAHNKMEVEAKVLSPIRHLAEMTHLLPASEKTHFKLPGGLFAFCLEVSLSSIRYAERRILTRATPEIRKEYEVLWAHAAFLNGLFSEAITSISKISVYAEDVGFEWHPGTESLYEWLRRNNLKRYHIRWSAKEDRSMIYILAGKAINTQQAEILALGEKAIYKTLLAALHDQTDFANPLAKINDQVKYKIMERDEWSYAGRYGKPLAGMHLEPWLIDAMRHLLNRKQWAPNEDNGRIWYGQDGVFLVWPLAASDMQYQLKESECPFSPSTQEILAEIMLDAGIIESNNGLNGYLFDIAVPVADSEEKKSIVALKLARHEILFVKNQVKPIPVNLLIEVMDDEGNKAGTEETPSIAVDHVTVQLNKPYTQNDINIASIAVKNPELQDYDFDQDVPSQTGRPTESIMDSQKTDFETVDIDILFGKKADPEVMPKGVQNKPTVIEDESELEGLSSIEPFSLSANQYDDDYVADYHLPEDVEYLSDAVLINSDSNNIQKLSDIDQSVRAVLILNRLKKLSTEFLEKRPGGMTKVMGTGLKNTKLELNDCVSVLKAAGLLELIDGYETGLDSTGKPKSRYFLVKADLLDGK
jgi:hypothetical protein